MAAKFQASSHVSRKCLLQLPLPSPLFLSSEQGHLRQHAEDEQQAPPHAEADPRGEPRQGTGGGRDPGETGAVRGDAAVDAAAPARKRKRQDGQQLDVAVHGGRPRKADGIERVHCQQFAKREQVQGLP